MKKTLSIAKKYGLKNEKAITKFVKKIIELTLNVEVEYILKKNYK
jgi:hypothetical protein